MCIFDRHAVYNQYNQVLSANYSPLICTALCIPMLLGDSFNAFDLLCNFQKINSFF